MIERTETAGAGTRAAALASYRLAAAGVLLLGLFLAGCAGLAEIQNPIEHFDTDAEASREDFREGLAARPPEEAEEPPPPIPELQPVISAPALGVPEEARVVTVAVNETTPLKEVLIELARAARVDLDHHPRIEGGVIFSAYERPFEEVVRRISDLAGLRHFMRDNVLRIELDEPYHVNYRIGYLSLVRRATSEVGTSATVVGGEGAGGGGSSSRVSGESEADFWSELEANITQIMTNTSRIRGLVAPPAPVAAVAPPAAAAAEAAPAPSVGEAITAPGAPVEAVPAPTAAVPAAAPAAGFAPTGAAAIPRLTPAFAEVSESFTTNRQAGILSVFGSQRQHRTIEEYLRKLQVAISAQVLIEAKILEVTLDEQYRFGIDWVSLFSSRLNIGAPFGTLVNAPPFSQLINPPGGGTATANVLTVAAGGATLQTIANLVQKFGTVRALSSPRITVMQNQTAVLKVAEEQVFFEVEIEQTTTAGDNPVVEKTVSSTINTVTVGLVMTVQPSINLDTEEITLSLRPTITSVASTEKDPAVELENVKVESLIPELKVQEIDTVVTMPSGSVLIMGGLMQDRITVDETGVPVLSEIPWLGQLFKSKEERTKKSELVILLRATITEGSMIDPADAAIYKRFSGDRHPFPM